MMKLTSEQVNLNFQCKSHRSTECSRPKGTQAVQASSSSSVVYAVTRQQMNKSKSSQTFMQKSNGRANHLKNSN